MKRTQKAAVLTGDLVKSSKLANAAKRKMLTTLDLVMKTGNRLMTDWNAEIFQGDSFQGATVKGTSESLRFALIIFMLFRKENMLIRIAIGIGDMGFETGNVLTSNGPAFVHSGRRLEELKKRSGTLIGLKTPDEETNHEFDVHCTTLDYLLSRCTTLQAEALLYALEGLTQTQIAGQIKVTQPTIQQRLQAAGWPVMKAILHRFGAKY